MNAVEPTWQPLEEHGGLTMRSNLPATVFTFPKRVELEEAAVRAVETKREHGLLEKAATKAATTRRRVGHERGEEV